MLRRPSCFPWGVTNVLVILLVGDKHHWYESSGAARAFNAQAVAVAKSFLGGQWFRCFMVFLGRFCLWFPVAFVWHFSNFDSESTN